MKLKKILVTCLALLVGIIALNSFTSQSVKADDVKVVKKISPNNDYPDIKTKLDVNNMSQYSDDGSDKSLFLGYTLTKFYIKDVKAKYLEFDHGNRIYQIVIAPKKSSNQLFLISGEFKKKLKLKKKITVQCDLNGWGTLSKNQSRSYSGKKVILTMPKRIAFNK